jgi:Protein of unknown function (DUF2568)
MPMPARDPVNESARRAAWAAVIAVCSFGAEIAMLVLLVASGLRIGSGLAVHVALAILFPVLAAAFWGIWAAPTSRRRLDDPPRLVAQIILFVITGVLAGAAHLTAWGLAFTVAAVAVFSLTRVFPSRPPAPANLDGTPSGA